MKYALLLTTFLGLFTAATCPAALVMSYTELAQGSPIDLTGEGNIDWVKWGNSQTDALGYAAVEKVGGSVIGPILTPLGDATGFGTAVGLATFTSGGNSSSASIPGTLEFSWSDGTVAMAGGSSVDAVVSEYIVGLTNPPNSYPIGLGVSFDAAAAATTQRLRVYVQGFNSDALLTASLSGGESSSLVISPTGRPAFSPSNDFAIGVLDVDFSGVGQTLTISATTQDPRTTGAQKDFANVGFMAATVAVPEPSSFLHLGVAFAALTLGYIQRTGKIRVTDGRA